MCRRWAKVGHGGRRPSYTCGIPGNCDDGEEKKNEARDADEESLETGVEGLVESPAASAEAGASSPILMRNDVAGVLPSAVGRIGRRSISAAWRARSSPQAASPMTRPAHQRACTGPEGGDVIDNPAGEEDSHDHKQAGEGGPGDLFCTFHE